MHLLTFCFYLVLINFTLDAILNFKYYYTTIKVNLFIFFHNRDKKKERCINVSNLVTWGVKGRELGEERRSN